MQKTVGPVWAIGSGLTTSQLDHADTDLLRKHEPSFVASDLSHNLNGRDTASQVGSPMTFRPPRSGFTQRRAGRGWAIGLAVFKLANQKFLLSGPPLPPDGPHR
jgi:hypothetical protein